MEGGFRRDVLYGFVDKMAINLLTTHDPKLRVVVVRRSPKEAFTRALLKIIRAVDKTRR